MGVVHRLGAGLDVLGASVPSAGLSLDGSPSIALPAVAGFREHRVADSGERRRILAAAERGHVLGTVVSALLRLLDTHGAEALENAIASALAAGTAHAAAVRQLLERRRQDAGQPPALPVELPADTRVRDLAVRPHDLGDYDKVGGAK